MKKDGKYRFSLQFGADSEEQVKAGELLERLGNKKSAVVVAALNDYLNSNPDLQDTHCKIEVKLTSGYNRDGIEEIIRRIVEERLATVHQDEYLIAFSEGNGTDTLEADIAQMLDNLDVFS